MLRALLEAGRPPGPGARHLGRRPQRRAGRGRPDPGGRRAAGRAVGERRRAAGEVYGDGAGAPGRAGPCAPAPTCTRPSRCATGSSHELGDLTFAELAVPFQCCAASIERAAEHWFTSGRVVDAVVASAAVPGLLRAGRGRRRALPRRRHRELDPGRPGRRVRRRPGLRAPGRPRRPAADRAAPSRGRWPGCRSRSPAGTASTARWPRCPTHVEAHVLPTGGGVGQRDDSLLAYRDFAAVDAPHRRRRTTPRRPTCGTSL